jgi:hypothetical protein
MQGMLPVEPAILVQFKLFLHIPAILLRGIIFSLAFGALKSNQLYRRFFCSHDLSPYIRKSE